MGMSSTRNALAPLILLFTPAALATNYKVELGRQRAYPENTIAVDQCSVSRVDGASFSRATCIVSYRKKISFSHIFISDAAGINRYWLGSKLGQTPAGQRVEVVENFAQYGLDGAFVARALKSTDQHWQKFELQFPVKFALSEELRPALVLAAFDPVTRARKLVCSVEFPFSYN